MIEPRTHLVSPQPALRTRDVMALGVTRGELAGPRWRAPHRGVQLPAGGDADDPLQRIYAAVELLPSGGALGGWAAAYLLGATDLDGRGFSGRELWDVPLVLPPRLHLSRRAGVVHWRSALRDEEIVTVKGIAATSPVRTAFDVCRRSPSLERAVAALDAMGRQIGVAAVDVAAYQSGHPHWRGNPRAREALSLTDPRSRSIGESRLRVLWVIDAGLPSPECNPYVVDGDGVVVGMPDLLLTCCGLVGEYDGEHHRSLEAHTVDNCREEDFEALGLVVVRATSLDLGPSRRETVRRLRVGYERAQRVAHADRGWGWRPSPTGNR